MERPDRFSLLLHRIVLARLLADPESVIEYARKHLVTMNQRAMRGHEAEVASRWNVLLEGPIHDLVRVLVNVDEESIQLRSSTPFVGFSTPDERNAALARSKVA